MKRLKQRLNKKQFSWFTLYPCCDKPVGYIHLNEEGYYVGVYLEKSKYKAFKNYHSAADWLNKIVAACPACSKKFKPLDFYVFTAVGRRKKVPISGEAMGNFGIYKKTGYHVIHIKNSFKIRTFNNRYRARRFIELLHETGLAKAFDKWVAGECKKSFGTVNSAKVTRLADACTYRSKEVIEKLKGADVLAEE